MRAALRLLISGLILIAILVATVLVTATAITFTVFALLISVLIIAIVSAVSIIFMFFGKGDLKIEKNGRVIFHGSPKEYLKQKARS